MSQPIEAEDLPGFIVAFTAAGKAASFMVESGETQWETRLISRRSIASLIQDLRDIGMLGSVLTRIKAGEEGK